MTWRWPLEGVRPDVPEAPHPGAFGVVRKHEVHTGVDLYAPRMTPVVSVEAGVVVAIEVFTGDSVGSSWWYQTWAALVEGESGVVCYGEIYPYVSVGRKVEAGEFLGYVERVLKKEARPQIPGHLPSMLHVELYESGTRATIAWRVGEPPPGGLQDPTYHLVEARASK